MDQNESINEWLTSLTESITRQTARLSVHSTQPSGKFNPGSPESRLLEKEALPVPEEVLRQLQMAFGLNSSLAWLTPGELRDAINSFLDDGSVFDDHEGLHGRSSFADKLHLTDAERFARSWNSKQEEEESSPTRFAKKIREEREQRQQAEDSPSLPDPL